MGGAYIIATSVSVELKVAGGAEVLTGGTAVSSNYELYENHPLASLFGKYNNDPIWKEIDRAIEKNRTNPDAD
jgi:predicted nucleic acid-binding protein